MATAHPIPNPRNFKHGGARDSGRTPEYAAWSDIKRRCGNPSFKHFKHYGGRGICVCARWLASFSNFLADVGLRPSKKHSIDRIDNNGNYEPGNCRWATRHEQMSNTRRNHLVTFEGQTRTITDWAKLLDMHPTNLKWRIANWGITTAFSTPIDRSHSRPRRPRKPRLG